MIYHFTGHQTLFHVPEHISQVLIVLGMYDFGRTLASELSKQLGITVSSTFACLLSTHLETAAKQRRNYFCKVALLVSFGLCSFKYGVQNKAIETCKRHPVVALHISKCLLAQYTSGNNCQAKQLYQCHLGYAISIN